MLIWTNSIFLYMLTYISLRVDRKLIHNLRYVKTILYFVLFYFGNAGRLQQTCTPRTNPHSPPLSQSFYTLACEVSWLQKSLAGKIEPKILRVRKPEICVQDHLINPVEITCFFFFGSAVAITLIPKLRVNGLKRSRSRP